MFCDVVGSTVLSQQRDPEIVREVLRRYQAACDKVIRQYGGHIAAYVGDGVLAYFGHPVAHEDDPHRAVRAGLDLLEALEPGHGRGARAVRPRPQHPSRGAHRPRRPSRDGFAVRAGSRCDRR